MFDHVNTIVFDASAKREKTRTRRVLAFETRQCQPLNASSTASSGDIPLQRSFSARVSTTRRNSSGSSDGSRASQRAVTASTQSAVVSSSATYSTLPSMSTTALLELFGITTRTFFPLLVVM